jgi:hypothetical protein
VNVLNDERNRTLRCQVNEQLNDVTERGFPRCRVHGAPARLGVSRNRETRDQARERVDRRPGYLPHALLTDFGDETTQSLSDRREWRGVIMKIDAAASKDDEPTSPGKRHRLSHDARFSDARVTRDEHDTERPGLSIDDSGTDGFQLVSAPDESESGIVSHGSIMDARMEKLGVLPMWIRTP